MRELPGIEAMPARVKPSNIALSFNLLLICFLFIIVFIIYYIKYSITSDSYFSEKKLINNLYLLKKNISLLSKNS